MLSASLLLGLFLALILVAINCAFASEEDCKDKEGCTKQLGSGYTCTNPWVSKNCCESCEDFKVKDCECVDANTRCNEFNGYGYTCEKR